MSSINAYLAIVTSDAVDATTWDWKTPSLDTANLLIPGDAMEAAHRRWIDVQSYRFDLSSNAGANSYGLSIVKTPDRSSPKLAKYCAAHTTIPWVVLEMEFTKRSVPTGADPNVNTHPANHQLTYFLKNVSISKFLAYDGGRQEEGAPRSLEEMILTYRGISVKYDSKNDGVIAEHWQY